MASLSGFFRSLFGRSASAVDEVSERVGDAAQNVGAAVGSAATTTADVVTEVVDQVVTQVGDHASGLNGDGEANVRYVARSIFDLPRSPIGDKALGFIRDKTGKHGAAKGLRVFEYALAGGAAYGLRPDKELMLLGSLFSVLEGEGGTSARQFCLENGMWSSLAEKVSASIESARTGSGAMDAESKLLSLGLEGERSAGAVDWLNSMTASEISKRHPA